MQKHTKIYFDYFNIAYDPVSGWHDFIKCELCGLEAIDIHHIDGRGKGKDVIENLMGLCREDHDEAGRNPTFNKKLKAKHLIYLNNGN